MINGNLFRDMIISAANNLDNKKSYINDLNVFPVPDGDTGTNMSLTISAAKHDIENMNDKPIGFVADAVAIALLKGARGNSGVILSLLFRGFAKELKNKTTANGFDMAKALESGVKFAYNAVMKPTEGTILTVARVSAEKSTRFARNKTDEIEVFEHILNTAEITLEDTPNMLPVLKQANVVDAGGKGLIAIFEGMLSVLKNNTIIKQETIKKEKTGDKANFESFNTDDIKFAYCTEFIVNKKTGADSGRINAFLQRMGDSVVCVEDQGIIKVHVHTNNPGKVLDEAISYGSLINIKIENMKEQHTAMTEIKGETEEMITVEPKKQIIAEQINSYGFVSVSAGDGLFEIFKDLGVDNIVEGGQTMNPSTEDLLAAVQSTPAKTVFILPNNKNIIMAAEQVVPIADRMVVVIPTKTIPQGISAMLEYNSESTVEENLENMTAAIKKVKTGQITFAARDSVFDGHEIKQGEMLGLIDGKVSIVKPDIEKCFNEILNKLVDNETNFINIFYGSDILEEDANKLKDGIKDINAEINIVNGGQPVYYYIISAE